MGYSNTTKLALRKDDGNESIVNWREHNNSNLDLLDATVGNLVDAINNAKLLLGQLGYDQNGNPVVDAATARDTLDAAQSEDAAGSLYDAEQAIGVNAGNIATNAAAISSLQDSVDSMMPATLTLTLHAGMYVAASGSSNGGRIWITTFVPIGYRAASVTSYPSEIRLLEAGTQTITTHSITGITEVNLGSNTVNIRLSATGITKEIQGTIASTTTITLSLTR